MDVSDVRIAQTSRVKDELALKCQKLFKNFLSEYNDDDISESENVAKYKSPALDLIKPERNTLFVDFEDLQKFDQDLATLVCQEFYRLYPYLCQSLSSFIQDESIKDGALNDDQESVATLISTLKNKDFYIGFYGPLAKLKIREMSATKIGQLVRIRGQVVRTHTVHPELILGTFQCLDCNTEIPNVEQQFKYTQPTICKNNLCANRSRFKLLLHKSRFVDFQRLRIQEVQAELPRGCMPRSLDVIIRGADQVECIQAGDQCDFIGTLIVIPDIGQMLSGQAGTVRTESGRNQATEDGVRGLKSLGVREMMHKVAFLANSCILEGSKVPVQLEDVNPIAGSDSTVKDLSAFNETDLQKIHAMTRDKHLFDNLVKSLFPSIYGNEEIKRGILLQLFGGVPKVTEEQTCLRGDINICIVGDPSTAKSNFLKIIADFAPTRAIYTSGKGSTASGLTAAVVRDEDGGFVIEAGALMLADRGICCIDEFDKMDVKDQVAIHEAMEQQTISITKAGVKATLNARTSILAAANPIGGHYDKSKSLRANLSLSLPIMSRFDLFFILLDECNEIVDYAIARRIVEMHMDADIEAREADCAAYTLDDIKRYIRFARQFKPKISMEAEKLLVETYKHLRISGGGFGNAGFGSQKQGWRITVRQLESLVRLSEALAKLFCSDYVTEQHVAEAAKLLGKSIVKIDQPDITLQDDDEHLPDSQDPLVSEPLSPDHRPEYTSSSAHTQASKGLKLSYEKYKSMADAMVIHLRREEAKMSESEGEGITRSQLIEWYLDQSEEIESEEELVKAKILCDKVIDRLIQIDHILIALKPSSAMETDSAAGSGDHSDDAILVVHPNYIPDDF